MLEQFDESVNLLSESIARRLTRRRVLINGMKGVVGSLAALSLGMLRTPLEALASNPGCSWLGGSTNKNCPQHPTCPQAPGCPSGCSICTDACAAHCPWPGGSWTVGSCGTCNLGWYVCTDCMCNSCDAYLCTCESICQCSRCCSPQSVSTELQRLGVAGEAA
jgi:hypothetical protein